MQIKKCFLKKNRIYSIVLSLLRKVTWYLVTWYLVTWYLKSLFTFQFSLFTLKICICQKKVVILQTEYIGNSRKSNKE